MTITQFPDPRTCTNSEGIIALGGDLEPASLLLAYRKGIFPWPMEGMPLGWFCPPKRAILRWENLHIPRSLVRARNRGEFGFSLNRAFRDVIESCATVPRPGQPGTWITEEMCDAYIELHRLGYAHSFETWRGDSLVGGLYGVEVDGVFSGESMFHRESNASKLALIYAMENLHGRGIEWMDIQMMTPHLAALGAEVVTRRQYLKMISE